MKKSGASEQEWCRLVPRAGTNSSPDMFVHIRTNKSDRAVHDNVYVLRTSTACRIVSSCPSRHRWKLLVKQTQTPRITSIG